MDAADVFLAYLQHRAGRRHQLMGLLNRHGWEAGLSAVAHQILPRLAAKAPPASFFLEAVETRCCTGINCIAGQNFAGI
jgi:hypothetical protein